MRVLLDACVPKGLRRSLYGHEVRTAHERLSRQQHIEDRPLGVAVLRARSNRLADLPPLVPDLLAALSVLKPGTVEEIGA